MTSHLDPPELHSRELLAALGRHHVRFLVVGGFAAQPWSISTSLGWRPGSRRDALPELRRLHTRKTINAPPAPAPPSRESPSVASGRSAAPARPAPGPMSRRPPTLGR